MDELKASGRPLRISKQEVWDAWLKVKGNQGAPGTGGQSVEAFGTGLRNSLYKVWNQMSSGAYFPPPVLAVEIPKPHGGGTRLLGCRPSRTSSWPAGLRVAFLPAISEDALNKISAEVRSWRLHRCTGVATADIAAWINPKVRGWMACYGTFYRSVLYPVLHRIDTHLLRWIMNKYKRLRTWKKAARSMAAAWPRYFTHWVWAKPASL